MPLRAGRQVLQSMYLLGNLAGHNNNYTNRIKSELFIDSGKVKFLSPLHCSFLSLKLRGTWTGKLLLLLNVTFYADNIAVDRLLRSFDKSAAAWDRKACSVLYSQTPAFSLQWTMPPGVLMSAVSVARRTTVSNLQNVKGKYYALFKLKPAFSTV